MDRALHITLIFIAITLFSYVRFFLKRYTRPSGRPGLLTLLGHAFVGDAGIFALIYAWFGLFSLRDLLFFMAVHGSLVIIPYLGWRLYKPVRVPYALALLRIYLELFYVRRWLFFAQLAIAFLVPLAVSAVVYWEFFTHIHHASYPAIFAVLTLSGGISLIALAIPSVWMLMHPALEDSARVRLMLSLYGGAILVFVLDLMAGAKGVLHDTKIRLLDAPYHLQISLGPAVIVIAVLVVLSIPMFRGATRQAEEVEELGEFEEGALRVISHGFRSLTMTDKLSFVDKQLAELRAREESFREELPPPGFLFRKIYDLYRKIADFVADEYGHTRPGQDDAADDDDLDELIEADLIRIGEHGLLWTTSNSWADRVAEIRDFGNHAEIAWQKEHAKQLEELDRSGRIMRYALKIQAFWQTVVANHVISYIRDSAKYLDQVKTKDFRSRHLFSLQELIASMTIMRAEIDRLQRSKIDRKYSEVL